MVNDNPALQENEVKETQKINDKQYTNPGTVVSAGIIEANEYDTIDRDTLYKDFERMRKSDPIVSTTLEMLKLPIKRAGWNIEQASEEPQSLVLQDYIQWCFDKINFNYFERHALLKLEYGASFFEKVYARGVTYQDSAGMQHVTNIIEKLVPFQLWTIEKFLYDSGWGLQAIEQYATDYLGTFVARQISADKLFWVVNNEEYYDVRGHSILRPIHQTWRAKDLTVKGTARAITRGAGIPVITVPDKNSKSQGQSIGRALGNSDEVYITKTPDIQVELLSVKEIGNSDKFLDFLNRELFFNTMTEFMTSGLGSNGSRAATESHKSSYELAASELLSSQERQINDKLIPEMINLSYLANVDKKHYPNFKYDAIDAIDVDAMTEKINMLYQTGIINKQQDDERFFRNIFGLPEVKTQTAELKTEPKLIECKHEYKQREGCVTPEMKLELNDRLLKNDPEKHFEDVQEKAQKIISEIETQMLSDVADQLERNPDAEIQVRFKRELTQKLQRLFDDSLNRGAVDFTKELSELTKKTELITKKQLEKINENIALTVTKFGQSIKNGIQKQINALKTNLLKKYPSYVEFTLSFEGKNKMIKRELITEVQSGYTAGRAEAIQENKEQVPLLVYNAILDNNLCDNCAPFDGQIFTQDEIDAGSAGIQRDPPVNLFCLGDGKCRCQLQPFQVQSLGIGG